MNLTITIGNNRATATVRTTLRNLRTLKLLDENDQNIVLSLIDSLIPKCNIASTRVRGLDYTIQIK
jgi:hypothetical protein